MNQQAELKESLAENPATIFLAPACNVDERCWCKDDQGPCDECGEPTVKYRRADLVDAEIARLRAEVDRYKEALRNLVNAADPWALSDTELAHAVNDGRHALEQSAGEVK